MSAWPRKLTSIMEIHRQRFSQFNQKFKQRPPVDLQAPSTMYPTILPQPSRPQPRQQARSKQEKQIHFPSTSPTRRSNTAHVRNQPLPFVHNQQYITLANLTKILHVLQTEEKTNDNIDTATETSTSSTTSAKQRVQQHLQETATRWWRPIRSSDSHPIPPILHTSDASTILQQYSDQNNQLQRNLPLITIVSNSTRQMNIHSTDANRNCKYDESETSTEIQPTKVLSSFVSPTKTLNIQRTRQEPLIMQARGMHVDSYDHRYYINHNNMNFFQQQRLIRQT